MTRRSFITEEAAEAALDFMRDNAEVAAKARAERTYVEDYAKSLKAQLMKSCGEMAVNAQEREAYADARYVKHLQAIKEAVFADEKIRFLMEAARAKLDAWRTQCANER